jgi:hypothetical protein
MKELRRVHESSGTSGESLAGQKSASGTLVALLPSDDASRSWQDSRFAATAAQNLSRNKPCKSLNLRGH